MVIRKKGIVRRAPPQVLVSLDQGDALHAILVRAREWGWNLLDLRLTRGSFPEHPRPRGALVNCLPTDPMARRLRKLGCPVVRIGQLPHPHDDQMPAVLPDKLAAGRLAAEHFLERGFTNLAHIGSKPWSIARPMHTGFRERAREAGLSPFLLRLGGDKPKDLGKSKGNKEAQNAAKFEDRAVLIGDWLASRPKPLAVLTYGDYMAAQLCIIAQGVGLSVPEDVAILGIGNNEQICEVSPVALSSIDAAASEIGRQGALLLRGLMDGAAPPAQPILVPPRRIVVRRSTEVLAVGDPMVARAMRFMWDHFEQNISVADVAAEVGVARRSLERAFGAQLGRGINAELKRRRLERLCELLKTTDLPIMDLAPAVGFRSADYLHAAFRSAFGMTPQKYRWATRSGP